MLIREYYISDFLTSFHNVYTVNYDPFTYLAISRIIKKKGRKYTDCILFDGNYLDYNNSEDRVISRLNDSSTRKLLYLHGGFHLFIRESGIIRYYRTNNDFRRTVRNLFKTKEEQPLLVFEVNSERKQEIINNNNFLKAAHEHLKVSKGKLLIFGMSFRNDNHILKLLSESNAEKIFITFFQKHEYKYFFKLLADNGYHNFIQRIYPYKISKHSKHILWEKARRTPFEKKLLRWDNYGLNLI